VDGYIYAASQVQGFKRLFDYISGENQPNVKINMTGVKRTCMYHREASTYFVYM